MGNIFDSIAIRTAINAAIFYHKNGNPDELIIRGIAESLEKSLEEAKEIFEKEVLKTGTVDSV